MPPNTSLLDLVTRGAVVVFIGSHPDDETVVGSLLAYIADRANDVWVVSLTRGEAGWNLDKEDRSRTLTAVREVEFAEAVSILKAKPVLFDYVNGVSKAHPEGLAVAEAEDPAMLRWDTKGDHAQTPDGVYARWTRDAGDPADKIATFLRQKNADVVVTLEPERGFTDHPEHIATAHATLRAVRASSRSMALYYAYPNDAKGVDGERIPVERLNAQGGKDYARIAVQSWSCYRSQFRVSAPPPAVPSSPDVQAHLLMRVQRVQP
jgi:LmbE family N-acetylglucosaminyl deacetylase